jgi:hypothetical protein
MNTPNTRRSIAHALRRLLAPLSFAALLFSTGAVAAEDSSGWSVRLTPVLLLPKGAHHWGGGADPELAYTLDLGGARLSAGARIGAYYAKNLFGLTAMPTLRLVAPVGPVEPYVAFGMGYGWLPKTDQGNIATMSRIGIVFRFTARFAIGLEGTVQKIERTDFRFTSLGSMLSVAL